MYYQTFSLGDKPSPVATEYWDKIPQIAIYFKPNF